MNGRYSVASGGRQDVPFNDDYASKGHEYFDVYSPELATHYGELYMGFVKKVSVPESIARRFNGKVMAITGYEFDNVMVEPTGQPGVNSTMDFSVPINWVYNHHYSFYVLGQHAELREVPTEPADWWAGGTGTKRVPVDLPSAALRADPSIPTSQWFSEGNGGEARKSFHGYPEGFAQLVDSPTEVSIFVMSIDTRNRDCGIRRDDLQKCPRLTPGPEPRQARYGRGVPPQGTNYSGLLECPCTSRFGGDPAIYPGTKTKKADSDGLLCQASGGGCKPSHGGCAPEPQGDLLEQKNPTCSGHTYSGGVVCCRTDSPEMTRILLDADQEVRPELLRFHLKYRIWFKEYDQKLKSHVNLKRFYWLTEAHAGEYDVPPAFARPGQPLLGYPGWPEGTPTPGTSCRGACPDGPDCECEHTITARWNVSNVRLIYGGGHCHAPACISMELYRNDTGIPQLLCQQLALVGKGNPDDRFDEPGYLRIPPCLWSDTDPSLENTQFLPANTPLVSVIRVTNTHVGHYGNMASWQMRGLDFPGDTLAFI